MFEHELIEIPLMELHTASWNYKGSDKKTMKKLIANMKINGQIQLLIVRELGKSKYEIINGNHRFEALLDLGFKSAVCLNLGMVSLAHAKRIAFETNETEFEADNVKLSDMVKELSKTFTMEDLEETLPFSKKEMQAMFDVTSFGTSEEDVGEEPEIDMTPSDEDFDFDSATSSPSERLEKDDHVISEYLMSEEVRDDFLVTMQKLKQSKDFSSTINNDAEISFVIGLINKQIDLRKNARKIGQ
jgi:hypothetical protein